MSVKEDSACMVPNKFATRIMSKHYKSSGSTQPSPRFESSILLRALSENSSEGGLYAYCSVYVSESRDLCYPQSNGYAVWCKGQRLLAYTRGSSPTTTAR